MPRVIGIDPGTVSLDICGLDGGRLFLDRSLPTPEALADPSVVVGWLEAAGPLDFVAGPSGYGLPLTAARDLTEADLTLAYLTRAGETGGIGGLRSLMRALGASALPVVLTPGVIHWSPCRRTHSYIPSGKVLRIQGITHMVVAQSPSYATESAGVQLAGSRVLLSSDRGLISCP